MAGTGWTGLPNNMPWGRMGVLLLQRKTNGAVGWGFPLNPNTGHTCGHTSTCGSIFVSTNTREDPKPSVGSRGAGPAGTGLPPGSAAQPVGSPAPTPTQELSLTAPFTRSRAQQRGAALSTP